MKKKGLLLSFILASFLFSCSNEEQLTVDQNHILTPNSSVINTSGENAGVSYKVKDLAIDPNIVFLNKSNVSLISSTDELNAGILKLSNVSQNILPTLSAGTIAYVNIDKYASVREISSITQENDNITLYTAEGSLSDVFPDGSIGFTMDFNPETLASTRGSISKEHDFLNIDEVFDLGDDFKCAFKSNLKMAFDVTLTFKKGQISPTELSIICKATPNFDTQFTGYKSFNKTYEENFRKFIPEQIMDILKNYEIDYNIPVTSDIELPVKIKLEEIDIPVYIDANLSNETDFKLGLQGSFKTGFTYTANGWNRDIKGVYENNLNATLPDTQSLNGELITDIRLIITPKITVTNDITAIGQITLGVSSESNNYMSFAEKPVVGSKGSFITKANVDVNMPILGKIPVTLANETRELWNVGTIKKELLITNITPNVTSKYSEIFRTVRQYQTDFTVNYKYPIRGKKITSEVEITYEVPTILGGWDKKTRTLEAKNITENSFKFTVDIPFYWKVISILRGEWRTDSKIRNIIVKDKYGSECTLNGEFQVKR